MTATVQQAIDIFGRRSQQEQDIMLVALQQLSEVYERQRYERNEAYLSKIRRGIKQCAEGRGINRDIIEVFDE